MNTEQARRIIALHNNHDRALANLRNAGAMSTDDPRAIELLESAGDAYAASLADLLTEQERTCRPLLKAFVTAPSGPETPSKPSADPEPPEAA